MRNKARNLGIFLGSMVIVAVFTYLIANKRRLALLLVRVPRASNYRYLYTTAAVTTNNNGATALSANTVYGTGSTSSVNDWIHNWTGW